LSKNPLPATLLVTPDVDKDIDALIKTIESFEAVDQVQFDFIWLQRLRALLEVIDQIALVLAALLGTGVILILGNTIRLEIESRRDEVAVVKLVGGTNAFVQRPLLYTGVWFGLLGALIAWFLTNLFAWAMSKPLDSLGQLYLRDLSLVGLDSLELLVLLVLGIFLGWLGAWIAAARHLSAIEPG
jgi:cell division transport system permease protein